VKISSSVFDHLDIAVSDLDASRAFYKVALGEPTVEGEWVEWGAFGITTVNDTHPPSRRLHVGFGVEDRGAVDAWWQRMVDAGYRSDGEPGPRPEYTETYYGGFILDPDGNSVEAVHHYRSRPGEIDHVWFRTTDVAEVRRLYTAIAPAVGIELVRDQADLVRFSDGVGSFTFVAGDQPTEAVHFAFGVGDFAAVKEFHRLATEAGFRDNGAAGERPQYRPRYYGAFALDPANNNVEAVFHEPLGP
jgi:catechol 2,3-dioxygenase-like lactoylglutathione lyase family enzyme